MLFGDRLNLPKFGFKGDGAKYKKYGGWGALLLGILFALAFCPSSGVFYFAMPIPMSMTEAGGYFLPIIFAIATALPVIIVAYILAYSVNAIGSFYGKIQTFQKWLNWFVGVLFVLIGLYYGYTIYF